MNETAPHYLLFTEAKNSANGPGHGGHWRFVLEQIGTTARIEESDDEPDTRGERLQLLSVVRGLEALEQPSRVTLITSSKYVGRGIRRSMTQWRENDWQWEHFGQMTPIKCHDLWQRIDLSMQIHKINCRIWQFDPPHVRTQTPRSVEQPGTQPKEQPAMKRPRSTAGGIVLDASRTNYSGSSGLRNDTVHSGIRSNRISIGTGRSAAIEATIASVTRVSSSIFQKIKPMGQGRAYGYAVT